MPKLFDVESGRLVATLNDEELAFLVDRLEEESSGDRDYYIDRDTIAVLAEDGAPRRVLDALEAALDGRDSGDVRWEPDA